MSENKCEFCGAPTMTVLCACALPLTDEAKAKLAEWLRPMPDLSFRALPGDARPKAG